MPAAPLRIRAEDKEDLAIIAAAIQDAAFLMGDVAYDPRARRFSATLNRFRWDTAKKRGPYERIRSVLALDTVLAVKSRKVRLGAAEAAGVLLDVDFEAGAESPAGVVILRLGGGGDIRLEVECIDATLTDLGAPWPTPTRPDHERY